MVLATALGRGVKTTCAMMCEDDLCHNVLLLVEVRHPQLAEVRHQGPRVVPGAHGVDCDGTELEVDSLR